MVPHVGMVTAFGWHSHPVRNGQKPQGPQGEGGQRTQLGCVPKSQGPALQHGETPRPHVKILLCFQISWALAGQCISQRYHP